MSHPSSPLHRRLSLPSWLILTVAFFGLGLALLLLGRPAEAQDNLVRNPSFEGGYSAWNSIPEVQVAPDWTPWWVAQQPSDPPEINRRPEYKRADGALYPNRVRSGSAAQQYFTFHATHNAGLYQQVSGVPVGSRVQFTVWGQVWSSNYDDPNVSTEPGIINMQVGIDPTGDSNPWAGTVVWSGVYNIYDTWFQLAVEAVAQNGTVTLFMKSAPAYPVKHNDVYFDDASLVVVGSAPPPPTETPEATATESSPAEPTATATPEATATSEPTEIPPTAPPPTATPTCAPPPADWEPYVVQPGEYLTMLSVRYDTSVAEIIAANCLGRDNLYNGETLLLPPLPEQPTQLPPTETPVPAEPTATEAAATEAAATEAAATEPPAATATPVEIAAATLTPSLVPPPSETPAASPTASATTELVESVEPPETAEPRINLPVSELELAGICGAALGITVALIGISFVVRNRRAGSPRS